MVTLIYKIVSEIWGLPLGKNLGPKNTKTWAKFWTTSPLDREYLQNKTRYRQTANGVANRKHSYGREQNLVNFGPQTPKNRTGVCVKVITQYVSGPLSRKRLQIQTPIQWSTRRKWHPGYQMVACLMTSRDPKSSKS